MLHLFQIVKENCQFWPAASIQSHWAGTTDVPKLKQYIETKYRDEKPADVFIAWQWLVTPDAMSVLQNVVGSIKDIADKIMPVLVEWLVDKKAGDQGVNICVADFVDLLDFPSKVISLNYR